MLVGYAHLPEGKRRENKVLLTIFRGTKGTKKITKFKKSKKKIIKMSRKLRAVLRVVATGVVH